MDARSVSPSTISTISTPSWSQIHAVDDSDTARRYESNWTQYHTNLGRKPIERRGEREASKLQNKYPLTFELFANNRPREKANKVGLSRYLCTA